MNRILVGVDGSKESRSAAKLAAAIAQATGSQLTLASVVQPVDPTFGAPELIARDELREAEEEQKASGMLKDLASSLGPGLTVDTRVVTGAAATALAELAGSGEVELVVVGHRGRNALARTLLGSVADRLAQISPKSVLVVR